MGIERPSSCWSSVETVYALTSLDHRDADPRLLASWIRSHWTIENRLHWVRDVTQGEDHSTIWTGNGPQVMAALRNTAINIIRLRGGTNIAAARRHFSYRSADVSDALTAARPPETPCSKAAFTTLQQPWETFGNISRYVSIRVRGGSAGLPVLGVPMTRA